MKWKILQSKKREANKRVEKASNWFPVGVEASIQAKQELASKDPQKLINVTELKYLVFKAN